MQETRLRTLVRSITYRLTAFLLTIVITYVFTGDMAKSTGFSFLVHLVLSLDYYIHERLWLRVKWGLKAS